MPRRKITLSHPDTGAGLPVIGRQIRLFREKRALEQKELAEKLGVSANAVSNWECGRGRPDYNLLPALCRTLGITLYELFGLEAPAPRQSGREQQLIGRFRVLSSAHKTAVEQLTETLFGIDSAAAVPRLRKLIFYGRPLSAGPGDPTEFEQEGTPLWVFSSREAERADCVFAVNGDSMEPAYHNGDLVFVSRITEAAELKDGETGAFIAGNETYIKVRGKEGLLSLNPAYQPLRFDESTPVCLIGKVTGVLKPSQIAPEETVRHYLAQQAEERR